MPTLQTTRIVVVGAGPSGIAAATKLLAAGFENVLLLEAESRFGGRIYTIPFADNVIDLGAQWCHGEKDNAVYETLKEKNQLDLLQSTGSVNDNYRCIRSNKEILPTELIEKFKSVIFSEELEKNEGLEDYEGSFGSYLTEKFWSGIEALPTKVDKKLTKEFFDNYKKAECSLEGSDNLFEVAGKGYLDYSTCEGDQVLGWKNKGYKTFLEILMKSTAENPLGVLEKHILFNHRVEKIDWQHSKGVKINCYNGEIVMADHVIVTCSLGVLKEFHSSMFTPSLPAAKIRAINGLKLGTVNKFYMEFEEPVGPAEWPGMSFLWLEEDLKALRDSEYFWLESVFGFYRVSHQPRLLQGWIIGQHARHMETLPEEEVKEALLWLFQKFLSFPVPNPVKFLRTHWHSNVNFKGSYSFRTMLSDELRTGASDLATPLMSRDAKTPVLQFAGEATNSNHYSTVHGAVESGWREAQRLMDLYKVKSSQL